MLQVKKSEIQLIKKLKNIFFEKKFQLFRLSIPLLIFSYLNEEKVEKLIAIYVDCFEFSSFLCDTSKNYNRATVLWNGKVEKVVASFFKKIPKSRSVDF